MIGIIPAAGAGTRIRNQCKALFKVNGKPIIEHILQNFLELGIKKVYIIQHGETIRKAIGDDYLGLALIYTQQNEQKGLANAISIAKVAEDVCIILGDIIYLGDLNGMKKHFEVYNLECLFGVKEVKDKELIKPSYGITKDYKAIEKPKDINNLLPLLGLGIYMAKPSIFYHLTRTKEFTNVLNLFPKGDVKFHKLDGDYFNINTLEDLKKANEIKRT